MRINESDASESKFEGMSSEEIFVRARDKAFRFLAYRARSSKEMTEKLLSEQYPSEIIARVIELLMKYNYINDTEFARNYVESRINSRGYGELRLRHELRQKGVKNEIINEIFSSLEVDEVEIAVALLDKRQRGDTEADRAEKNRCYGFLQRRGYSSGVIMQAFKQYFT